MDDRISNPDPESFDPEGDLSAAKAAGMIGLESGAAPWVMDGSYPQTVRLHGIVRRVSHHDEIFSDRKRPPKMTTLVVEFPQLGQTVMVTMRAIDAVAFAAPDALVTFDNFLNVQLVSSGHLPLDRER